MQHAQAKATLHPGPLLKQLHLILKNHETPFGIYLRDLERWLTRPAVNEGWLIYLQSPSKTVQSTKFSREVFYKKVSPCSAHTRVCAPSVCPGTRKERRRRERRGLEPYSGMQRKDKSSWPWTEIENISWDPKKKPFSQWGWPSTGAGCPESLWRGCWALSWWKWSPCFAFTFPCPNSEPRHSHSFALCSRSASQEDACKSRRQFLYTSQSNLPNHDLKQNPITGPLFCPLDYY